jgi:hypothetical protein
MQFLGILWNSLPPLSAQLSMKTTYLQNVGIFGRFLPQKIPLCIPQQVLLVLAVLEACINPLDKSLSLVVLD